MPICPGCEQKVPYQELDIHQRYCDGKCDDAEARTADRVQARMSLVDEYVQLAEERLRDRLVAPAGETELPTDEAGIEGSNIRFKRDAPEQEVARR